MICGCVLLSAFSRHLFATHFSGWKGDWKMFLPASFSRAWRSSRRLREARLKPAERLVRAEITTG
jgi:hypothetical protein